MFLTIPPPLTFPFLQLRNKEAISDKMQAEEGEGEAAAAEGDAVLENTPEMEAKKDGVCG